MKPPAPPEKGAVGKWTPAEVNGRKVYQRDDLFEASPKNIAEMKKGNAPFGSDGNRVELHHLLQEEPGPMAEVLKTLHRRIPNKQVDTSFRNDPVLNQSYKNFKSNYWKIRAKDF